MEHLDNLLVAIIQNNVREKEIHKQTNLKNDLGWENQNIINLLMYLEENLETNFSEKYYKLIPKDPTIENLAKKIEPYLKGMKITPVYNPISIFPQKKFSDYFNFNK